MIESYLQRGKYVCLVGCKTFMDLLQYFYFSEHEYPFIPFLEMANTALDGQPVTVCLCEAPLESVWKNTVNTFICEVPVRLDSWSLFFPLTTTYWDVLFTYLVPPHFLCSLPTPTGLSAGVPSLHKWILGAFLCPLPSPVPQMKRRSRVGHFRVIIFHCEFIPKLRASSCSLGCGHSPSITDVQWIATSPPCLSWKLTWLQHRAAFAPLLTFLQELNIHFSQMIDCRTSSRNAGRTTPRDSTHPVVERPDMGFCQETLNMTCGHRTWLGASWASVSSSVRW